MANKDDKKGAKRKEVAKVKGGETVETKTDKTEQEPDEAILRQVGERLSYFFSDANMRNDRYMRIELNEGKNSIPITKLLKFNSINCITTDPKVLALATEKICGSKLELKDGMSIGRKDPFDYEKSKGKNIDLSIFISNLPINGYKYVVPFKDIYPLFTVYGNVTLVKYRYNNRKGPDDGHNNLGTGFVEFETEEELGKAVKDLVSDEDGVEPKRKITLKDNVLNVQTMRKWFNSTYDQQKEKDDPADKKENGDETSKRKREEKEREIPTFKIDWKKGCVLSLKGLPDSCDREGILEALNDYKEAFGGKPYVDYSRGQTNGAIRFDKPNDEKMLELATKFTDGTVKIYGKAIEEAVKLDGEKEEKYWADFIEFKNKQMKQQSLNRSNKRGRFNGGGFRGGGRGRGSGQNYRRGGGRGGGGRGRR